MKSRLPNLFVILLTASALSVLSVESAEYSSRHDWNFPSGNLIANWSFEEFSPELCAEAYENSVELKPDQFDYHCRHKNDPVAGEPPPLRGYYALKVVTSNSAQFKRAQISAAIKVDPGSAFKSSFHFHMTRNGSNSNNYPVVSIFDAFGTLLEMVEGPSYESIMGNSTGRWVSYPLDFSVPANACHIKISFVNARASMDNDGNIIYFDDLLISKATLPSADVYEERLYGDALGALDHRVRNDRIVNVVEKAAYNSQRQMTHHYLPLPVFGDRTNNILISALDLYPIVPDFTNLEEAYAAVAERVGRTPSGNLPEEITFYVIVSAYGDLAPQGTTDYDILPLVSQDGALIPLILDHAIKDSPAYVQLIQGREAQVIGNFSGPFEPAEDFLDLLTEYYGIDNPYSQFAYPNEGTHTTEKSALPGTGYELDGAGNHIDKSGSALLTSDALPSTPEFNPGTSGSPATAEYVYAWQRDRQGNYQLRS